MKAPSRANFCNGSSSSIADNWKTTRCWFRGLRATRFTLGLYFPMLDAWREWQFGEEMRLGAG